MLVSIIAVPMASILTTNYKTAAQVEQRLNALALAQAHLEELLADGSKAWTNQPFHPVPDNHDFQLAVDVTRLPARLYEINVYVRWGEVPYDQILELSTLATPTDRSKP